MSMPLRFADAIFWIAVACCLVGHLSILRSVLASRAVPTNGQTAESQTRRMSEVVWASVPAVALAAVLVFTWRVMHPA